MENSHHYSSDWIHKLETENHWRYYWHQQKIMEGLIQPTDQILEIGVGSKFTSNYLKSRNFNVKTIDIDAEKSPDIVANIIDYQSNERFDHILAFEIFEHLPFDAFEKAIHNLSAICNKTMFVSLPRNEKLRFRLSLNLKLFKINDFQIATKRNKILTKLHFWEIDYKSYTRKRIIEVFLSNGFQLKAHHKFQSLCYFVFQKVDNAQ
ncbi:MAG: hypothetical protein PF489_08820 [Salinivirgaceae bacterium]|jgi:hypothetical protein|nr:hypothetical protein [Salinivirgaceae bacterium]